MHLVRATKMLRKLRSNCTYIIRPHDSSQVKIGQTWTKNVLMEINYSSLTNYIAYNSYKRANLQCQILVRIPELKFQKSIIETLVEFCEVFKFLYDSSLFKADTWARHKNINHKFEEVWVCEILKWLIFKSDLLA